MSQKVLLSEKEIHIILHRLACQLLESHLDFSNTVLIGLQPRGIFLAKRLAQILQEDYKVKDIALGFLDITFLVVRHFLTGTAWIHCRFQFCLLLFLS